MPEIITDLSSTRLSKSNFGGIERSQHKLASQIYSGNMHDLEKHPRFPPENTQFGPRNNYKTTLLAKVWSGYMDQM